MNRLPSTITASRPGVVVTHGPRRCFTSVHEQLGAGRNEGHVARLEDRPLPVERDRQLPFDHVEHLVTARPMGGPAQIGRDGQLPGADLGVGPRRRYVGAEGAAVNLVHGSLVGSDDGHDLSHIVRFLDIWSSNLTGLSSSGMTDDERFAIAGLVLRASTELVEGIQQGLAAQGFDDVRPAHGFAFVRISMGDRR